MFKLEFTTDNAAFEGDELYMKAGRIVTAIGERVADGQTKGACWDSNGNRVGEWSLTADQQEGQP